MTVTKTFNKTAPVSEASILRLFGVNSTGYSVFLENQDPSNTVVYTFQDSPDGAAWTDIQFTVNGSPQADFALLAGTSQQLKVTSGQPYIRLTAYGDAALALTVAYSKPSLATGETQMFEAA